MEKDTRSIPKKEKEPVTALTGENTEPSTALTDGNIEPLKGKETLPEELYGVLAELLNRKNNIAVLNSIRGEYGVLNCLIEMEEGLSAGELGRRLHVVPGRMADILKSLEAKQLINRRRDDEDKRVVKVTITEEGREVSREKREEIHQEYEGLFRLLGEEDVKELIRLLKIVLSYYPER